MRLVLCITYYLLCFLLPSQLLSTNLEVTYLRCEYLVNPLAIEKINPRLSWELESNSRAEIQTAYQLLVASSPDLLSRGESDLWDSGKVPSNRTNQIHYAGKRLSSRQDCYWKVRIWDKNGQVSAWSKGAHWKIGLLDRSDWKAHWIGFDNRRLNKNKTFHLPPSPYFRKSWQAKANIKRAILYSTALGLYEARINGEKVGEDYFAPGWTDYNQRVYYQTYEVTEMIQRGGNAIGFTLANGWYAGYTGYAVLVGHPQQYAFYGEVPVFKAQLEIEYENGEKEFIVSDADWKVKIGPILEADILMGDAQIYIRTATYNTDIAAFHQKWLVDLNDAQFGNGAYPNFAPMAFHRPNMTYSPGWMDAGIICTYNIFKVYNDIELVQKFYPNMQNQLHLYAQKSEHNLLPEGSFDEVVPTGGFGDWLNQDETATSKVLIANIYWLFDLRLMVEMAEAIGEIEDEQQYRITFRKVQNAFLEKYASIDGSLKENTQTACAMALDLDVLPYAVNRMDVS